MSLSSSRRAQVIRGAAALDIRSMPFEVDLARPTRVPAAVEAAVQRGYRDGVEAGHADGYRAGLASAVEDQHAAERQRAAVVEDLLVALERAVDALERARTAALMTTEDDIAVAAFAVAEAVLARELALAADPGAEAIARALALAPEGAATVRLNPGDIETLGELAFGRDITLVADPAVEPAGAIVDVGACRIDTQITTALSRVKKALGA